MAAEDFIRCSRGYGKRPPADRIERKVWRKARVKVTVIHVR